MRRQWWLLGAGAWSLLLLVAAFVAPVYGSTSTTSVASETDDTVIVHTTHATLVQVNGPGVLVPLALPFLAVVAVALLLPTHSRIAWTVTILVLCFCLVGMLTIGIFLLPIGILLVVACSRPTPAVR